MGMLVNGIWRALEDHTVVQGAYCPDGSFFDQTISDDVIHGMTECSRRYQLVASLSCPWSHRVLLVRAIKSLENHLPLHVAGGGRDEGYGIQPVGPLRLPGTTPRHVHQLYTCSVSDYSGRVTVPVLWDDSDRVIISNDSAKITRALDRVGGTGFTLHPHHLADKITALSESIHTGLSSAVYRAGLAQSQSAHDAAITDVFDTLEYLENRLSKARYLLGSGLTEPDLRLFATLVRFDAVYVTHFRCTRYRLTDYPNLWAYARDIYAWPGVSETVSFEAILDGYFRYDGSHNPHGIVPEQPSADWTAFSGRSSKGPANLWTDDGQEIPALVDEKQ